LREFIESVVRLVGIDRSPPGYRPPFGAVWLDGERLEECCWEHIRGLLDLTSTLTGTWMGFTWTGGCEARCDLQRDVGYGGVSVRVEVTPKFAAPIHAAARAVGGGIGTDQPGPAEEGLSE
jgi:hypothetical protein